MQPKPAFGIEDTHRILDQFQANIRGSSEGLGWSSAFASIQRERPYDGKLHALSDSLMVLHRGGPVNITYTVDGKPVIRHIPKGGVFFLPAGHECDVALHASLDSTHIYLRSDLFADEENAARNLVGGLAPILGERDAVLESLATAIGDTIIEGLPASSLFVDPIAKAIANRFIAINYHRPASGSGKQRYQLTNRQMERVRYASTRRMRVTRFSFAKSRGAEAARFRSSKGVQRTRRFLRRIQGQARFGARFVPAVIEDAHPLPRYAAIAP
jgi:AraC family transcriptional regulator